MDMLTERLQVLISGEQRRRLEDEARRRGTSVGQLVREAIDDRFGRVTEDDRLRALAKIRAMQGRYLPVAELNRLIDAEREAVVDGSSRAG